MKRSPLRRDSPKSKAWANAPGEAMKRTHLTRGKALNKRNKEHRDHLFRVQFHSAERVNFFHNLPCEVTGRRLVGIVNAHMKNRASGGTYRHVVPLHHLVHHDFDTMPEAKFERKHGRTKQSVRDRAPHYHQMWRRSA